MNLFFCPGPQLVGSNFSGEPERMGFVLSGEKALLLFTLAAFGGEQKQPALFQEKKGVIFNLEVEQHYRMLLFQSCYFPKFSY